MSERLGSKLLGLLGAPEPWESEASGKLRHGGNFKGTVTPSPFSLVLCPLNTGTMWSWRAQSTTATSLTVIYLPSTLPCSSCSHYSPYNIQRLPLPHLKKQEQTGFFLSICHSFNKYLWWRSRALRWILARADIWLGMTPDARVYSHYINIFKLLWELTVFPTSSVPLLNFYSHAITILICTKLPEKDTLFYTEWLSSTFFLFFKISQNSFSFPRIRLCPLQSSNRLLSWHF